MRLPYSIQGALFGPLFIGLALILKAFCPSNTTDMGCFADHLAIPIFLPLIMLYRAIGEEVLLKHELWFVFIYWIIVGLLIGLIFDLRSRRSRYSPEQRLPPL